jgi:hypothetical protein
MSSYLVFAITHCCQFPKLSLSKKVNWEFDPVTFWYQALCKHKASHCFYEVFNDFVSVFKVLLLGEDAPCISHQATKFLDRKGALEKMDNYSVIRIFGSKEKPALLPCHITNIMFVIEIIRQHNYWFHLFHEKRKKLFIPMPWKLGDFVLRNINKIDEFTAHFNNLNLRYVEILRWFDPNKLFLEHLLTLGLDNSFFQKHLSENKDTGDNALASDADDLDTLQSTTELYKQQGKGPCEKSVQSTNNTPKSMTSQSISPMAHHNKKATQNSSNEGGDNNPPHPKIDSFHKLPMEKKRKKIVGQTEEPEIESENMELESDLDSVFNNPDQPGDTIQHSHPIDIADTEIFDEGESFMFKSVVFDSESKKLIIEKIDVKNKKGKSRSEVDLSNMWSSQICRLHKETRDTLDYSIGGIEAENARLKDQVKELEEALIPMPFLSSPLAIALPATPTTRLK